MDRRREAACRYLWNGPATSLLRAFVTLVVDKLLSLHPLTGIRREEFHPKKSIQVSLPGRHRSVLRSFVASRFHR
eukprot:751915-Hanusia_phi.AAC.1